MNWHIGVYYIMWQHYAALLFHYVLGFSLCLCHHCIDAGFHLLKKKLWNINGLGSLLSFGSHWRQIPLTFMKYHRKYMKQEE